jgi:hypothetical protein
VHSILTFLRQLIRTRFQSFQHRFVEWTKPSNTSLTLGTVADLAKTKSELVAKNALLRRPLIILRRQVKQARMCQKGSRVPVASRKSGSDLEANTVHCPTIDASALASTGMRGCSGSTSPEQHLLSQRYLLRLWR